MFSTITEKFHSIFAKLTSSSQLKESNLKEVIEEVRLALLEADVQWDVVKHFIKRMKEKALGQEANWNLSPAQFFIKLVHDEIVELLGSVEKELVLDGRPLKVILCGLQGSGKTTHVAKLARFLKKQYKFTNACLVACDLARPAAVEQLRVLAHQAEVDFFSLSGEQKPQMVVKAALEQAKLKEWDLLIFDTAGRLAIDDHLMAELKEIKELISPHHTLLTMNAGIGQDAVKTATRFSNDIGISGSILTMLDGSSRGGAALSIVEVTKCPVYFEGYGERIDDIRLFHPNSLADRILGMGDTINLVRKAEEHFKEDEAKEMEAKLRKASFTYNDFLKQMQMIKKMGSLKSLLSMLPGMSQLKDLPVDESHFGKVEAIILSMTPGEREEKDELSMNRRKRLAKGSGLTIDDVNKLVKSFKQAKQFFKNLPSNKQLEKVFGGKVCH
jgi:signal recognition particle subunit SRP54